MMYRRLDCPTCGNEVTAKSEHEPQKCPWCKRLFKVIVKVKNPKSKRRKFNWTPEPVDFEEPYIKRPWSYDDRFNHE